MEPNANECAPSDAESGGPPMRITELLEHEIEGGERELDRPTRGLLLSGLSAGLDLAFGPMLIAVALTLTDGSDPLIRRLLAANAYAVGFAFVLVGRSELFTEHTTLAAFPALAGRATYRSVARLWGLVYVANIAGTIAAGALGALVLTALGVAHPPAFERMGRDMVDHAWWTIGVSAILAGWLMGLLSWMSRTTRSTLGQLAVVWLVTGTIGFAQLHHCIAGAAEVTMAIVMPGNAVTIGEALRFLVWATIGNAIGGVVFVALVKLGHARVPSRRE